jgi:hypothetical protein
VVVEPLSKSTAKMGYNTRFDGDFILDRPLSREHKVALERFAEMEHTPGEDGKPLAPECHWCQWVPSADGTRSCWDGQEKFYCWEEWLKYLIEHSLEPWGYRLNGEVL